MVVALRLGLEFRFRKIREGTIELKQLAKAAFVKTACGWLAIGQGGLGHRPILSFASPLD